MIMKVNEFNDQVQADYEWCKATFEELDPIAVVNSYIAEYTSSYVKEEYISLANIDMKMIKKWVAVRDLLIADRDKELIQKATENQ